VILIRGGASAHFPEADREPLARLFPAVEEAVIPDAGHWLHISHREEFVAAVRRFIEGLPAV
jgi:pimeloyl-ACP methyl ester carboxylesterase